MTSNSLVTGIREVALGSSFSALWGLDVFADDTLSVTAACLGASSPGPPPPSPARCYPTDGQWLSRTQPGDCGWDWKACNQPDVTWMCVFSWGQTHLFSKLLPPEKGFSGWVLSSELCCSPLTCLCASLQPRRDCKF